VVDQNNAFWDVEQQIDGAGNAARACG